MLDTSKQSFAWKLILFTPTLVVMIVSTLKLSWFGSSIFLVGWGVINAGCSLWCAYDHSQATVNLKLRFAKTLGIGLVLWILNAGMSFFGGCTCAYVLGGR